MESTHHHIEEWQQSGIRQSLISLNLKTLASDAIAEWYFQYLPRKARRNDGRIRDGYLRTYDLPMKGGWGIEGYDPTETAAEPELRCFKPDFPRIALEGKPIKYDMPQNAPHNPILPRVSYEIAMQVCRNAGVNFLEQTQKYAPNELITGINDWDECPWFWPMVLDNQTIPISITEGGKKALALLSRGRCAIAVTSITTWRAGKGSHKLHPWLALFAPQRRFYLTFDQDVKRASQTAVNIQSFRLGNATVKAGAQWVKRISWSGTAKGIDDFIYHLSHKYGDSYCGRILGKCYQNARSYLYFGKSRSLPGTIKKVNQRYLDPEALAEAANYKILVLKSAKGTNKTGVLGELVARDRAVGTPTINIAHLERLAREQGIRTGLPYRTAIGTVSLRNALGYSLCLDSLSPDNSVPFHPQHWTDAGVAMDEFTQVLHHLAFGKTELKHYRKLVCATLGQKLADCWSNNKPIRLLDADGDYESIESIYELIQLYCDHPVTREELENSTLTVINDYQPALGDLYFYHEPSPKLLRADLIEKMKQDLPLLIVSSSQKSASGDGTINLEKLAQKHYLPKQILRIDSQTTRDPEHPAYGITAPHLIDLVKNGFYKVIIASPTICTGISIDGLDGYFDAVFSFQAGNLTPNSVSQQLVRLRDFKVPRYLWCPQVGKSFIGSKSTNPIELLGDQKGEAILGLHLLGFKEAELLIESNICPVTKYWAKLGGRVNFENYHYREILIDRLEAEGWNLIPLSTGNDRQKLKLLKGVWHQRQEIKAESVVAMNHQLVTASDLTYTEAHNLERARTLTSTQQAQLDKHRIKQKYALDQVTPELVEADGQKLYPALRLRFWLTVGREYLEPGAREMLSKMRQRNRGSFFIPDFNRQNKMPQVKLLEMPQLNWQQFTRTETEWSNKSPELISLQQFVQGDLVRFNQILGSGIAQSDSPIVVVQKILKQIGLRLPYLRNERDGAQRLRIYGAAESRFKLEPQESDILNHWFKYYAAQFSEVDHSAAA